MALMPKRVKFRKSQKGRVRGNATRGNYVAFGEFGLQALEPARISAQTIEAGRVVASQLVKGGGKLYIRIFPQKSVTAIPAAQSAARHQGARSARPRRRSRRNACAKSSVPSAQSATTTIRDRVASR